MYIPGSTFCTSAVGLSCSTTGIVLLFVTALSTSCVIGAVIFPSTPGSCVNSVLTTDSLLKLSISKLLLCNSVPELSLNLTVRPSNKFSPTWSKLCPLSDMSFGTAVTLIVVCARDKFALVSVITFKPVFVP